MGHGKNYRSAVEKIDREKVYGVSEAIALIKGQTPGKFDETLEVHARLSINPKKSDQNVRVTVALPHGTGKSLRVMVITGTKEKEAKDAGADLVGGEDLVAAIKDGKKVPGRDFDIVIATPEMMPKLAQAAKILGPKGMMPSPKAETVTPKVAEAVLALKKGSRISFKNDDSGNVHSVIGKFSFEPKQLEENFEAFLGALKKAKPESHKGKFIIKLTVCSTMGPSLQIGL